MKLSDVAGPVAGERARRRMRRRARRDLLVEQHVFLVPLVAGQLRRRLSRWVDGDELLADGFIGLLRAAERYNRRHGVPFARFAGRYIRAAMIEPLRTALRRPRVVLLAECSFAEVDAGFEQVDARLDAMQLLARVPAARHRLVLRMRFLDEKELTEVADRIGVSGARVSQLVGHALRDLRRRVAA